MRPTKRTARQIHHPGALERLQALPDLADDESPLVQVVIKIARHGREPLVEKSSFGRQSGRWPTGLQLTTDHNH
jgi:hypothetical protein